MALAAGGSSPILYINKLATPPVVGPVDIDRLSLPGALCHRYCGTAPERDPVDIGLRSRLLASTIDSAVWLPGRMVAGSPRHLILIRTGGMFRFGSTSSRSLGG